MRLGRGAECPIRVCSLISKKGVIEIIFDIQTWQFDENATKVIDNSTCANSLYSHREVGQYSYIGVGLLFYLLHRYAKA